MADSIPFAVKQFVSLPGVDTIVGKIVSNRISVAKYIHENYIVAF